MPRAVRKSDAKPLPVDPVTTGKRAASAIGTRAMLDSMRNHDGADVTLHCKARIVDWHSAISQISGTLTVAFCKQGLSSEGALAIIKQLHLIADDMNLILFKEK